MPSEGTCFACRARLSRRIAGVAWLGELGRACWVGSCRGVPGWLLAIPCLWVACALCRLTGVLTIVAFFTVLFTQRIPRGVFELMVLEMRGNPRGSADAYFMTDPDFESGDHRPSRLSD